MIAPLLKALREKDPVTWEELQNMLRHLDGYLEDDNYDVIVTDTIERAGLPAWWILQGVLCDACQARGWDWQVWRQQRHWIGSGEYAATTGPVGRNAASGDSPAEALLSAYLEAIG